MINDSMNINEVPIPEYAQYSGRSCDNSCPPRVVYRVVKTTVNAMPTMWKENVKDESYVWTHRRNVGSINIEYEKYSCKCKYSTWDCKSLGKEKYMYKEWDFEWKVRTWHHGM